MTFYVFPTQEERKEFGGSCFVEIQFCKMDPAASVKRIVAVTSVEHWKADSLYICGGDMDQFYNEYSTIFDCGIYNNLNGGKMDLYGVNYYHPDSIEPIIAKIRALKPSDHQKIISWLAKAKDYNGFYILGV